MKQITKKRKSKSRAQWYDYYQDWKASGMSQIAYCQQQGLHSGTFYNWTAVFRKEPPKHKSKQKRPHISQFVPVEVQTPDSQNEFRLQYRDITLSYSGEPSPVQITQWIEALRGAKC